MSDEQKAREDEVFGQRLDSEELDVVSGGFCSIFFVACGEPNAFDKGNQDNCVKGLNRPIYGPDGNQFPNCAATVEKDSYCYNNDGCYSDAVVYKGQHTNCGRAWE